MINKTRPPADSPPSREVSEGTRETIRQLAEITERYAAWPALGHSAAQPAPAATAPAVAPPPSPQGKRDNERDAKALAAMADVTMRARAQQAAARIALTQEGPLATIEPDYVAEHKSMPLQLSRVGSARSDGTCAYQQDVAVADWYPQGKIGVAAVCDGHGPEAPGEIMPWQVLQNHLIDTLRAHLPAPETRESSSPHRVRRALTRAISGARANPRAPLSVVEQMDQCNAVDNGSTLVAAVRIQNAVYVANVGDSRAVLVRRDGSARQMTVDHKTYEPEEWKLVQRRVMAGEALVERTFPHRMLRHARNGAVYGISMSRSIGDDAATVSTPEISMFHIDRDDVALVLCSDGIFDTVHNDQVGLYVSAVMARRSGERLETLAQRAAEGLVGWCYDTETYYDKSEASIDNLTALVLPLQAER